MHDVVVSPHERNEFCKAHYIAPARVSSVRTIMLGQRQVYKVVSYPDCKRQPIIMISRRLQKVHDGSRMKPLASEEDTSSSYTICLRASMSLLVLLQSSRDSTDNLSDVTLHLNARILSSLLEISHCKNLTIHFSTVPAIIQIDPHIRGLVMHFSGCEPATFVVAPRTHPQGADAGLTDISAVISEEDKAGPGESRFVLADAGGVINDELLRSAAGRRGEQYKIAQSRVGEVRKWTMEPIDKEKSGSLL